jgi:hypothetical protein
MMLFVCHVLFSVKKYRTLEENQTVRNECVSSRRSNSKYRKYRTLRENLILNTWRQCSV